MPVSGWFGLRAEEGRAKQRNAPGRRKESVNRGFPNRTSVPLVVNPSGWGTPRSETSQ